MRKNYLDNIRWCTIILVVFFHVFFFFNNIGTTAIFQGLGEYQPNDPMCFGGIYQYAVYPWFMTLFVISVVLILVRKIVIAYRKRNGRISRRNQRFI